MSTPPALAPGHIVKLTDTARTSKYLRHTLGPLVEAEATVMELDPPHTIHGKTPMHITTPSLTHPLGQTIAHVPKNAGACITFHGDNLRRRFHIPFTDLTFIRIK